MSHIFVYLKVDVVDIPGINLYECTSNNIYQIIFFVEFSVHNISLIRPVTRQYSTPEDGPNYLAPATTFISIRGYNRLDI